MAGLNGDGGGGGGKKKLPTWIWYVGGGVVGLVVLFLIARQSSSSGSGAATITPATGSSSPSTTDAQALNATQGQLASVTSAYEGLVSSLQASQPSNSPATQPELAAGASGYVTQNGNTYGYYVSGPNEGLGQVATKFYGGAAAGPSVLQHFNPNATSDAAGYTFWTIPAGPGEGVGTPLYSGQPPAAAYQGATQQAAAG